MLLVTYLGIYRLIWPSFMLSNNRLYEQLEKQRASHVEENLKSMETIKSFAEMGAQQNLTLQNLVASIGNIPKCNYEKPGQQPTIH